MRLSKAWFFILLLQQAVLTAQGDVYSVISCNIRYDEPADGRNNWYNRKKALVDFLVSPFSNDALQPLVLGIQEGLHHQVMYIDSLLGNYSFTGCGRDDGGQKGEYCAIFYNQDKVSVLSSGTFWLSETPDKPSRGWDAALPRICTYALFQSNPEGTPFYVFNCHLDHMGVQARKESVRLMEYMIQKINYRRYPVIVMGDFNMVPEDLPWTNPATQWSDSWLSAEEKEGPVGTFHAFGKEEKHRRIDYIFLRGIEVLSSRHLSVSQNSGTFLTDHLPVQALLRFEK